MPWEPYFPTLMQVEKQLHVIENRQFVGLGHQVVKRVQSLLTAGRSAGKIPFARVEVETSDEWKTLRNQEDDEACGEALLWLEELLKEL